MRVDLHGPVYLKHGSWAHRNLRPKRLRDWFSRFSTFHGGCAHQHTEQDRDKRMAVGQICEVGVNVRVT